MKKLTFILSITMILGLTSLGNATLWDRGGGLIYDDVLKITWLQDANYAMISGYDADGRMTWNDAMTWATNLVYNGYEDWRLPTALNSDGSGPGDGYNFPGSEMGNLFYLTLGNSAGYGVTSLTNTGLFANVQEAMYWSSTHHISIADRAWSFSFRDGGQGYTLDWQADQYAWAVRTGDVPEPTTMLLLGLGLMGLAGVRSKFQK